MNVRRSFSVRLKGGLLACLTLMLAAPAFAQDTCETLGTTIESLAIVQALSADPDSRTLARRLERSAASLQASGLTQADTNSLTLDEQTALQNYVTAVQQAAVLAEAGLVEDARAIVVPHVKAELFSSISVLEQQFECVPEDTSTAPSDDSVGSGGQTAQAGQSGSQSPLGRPGNPANGGASGPGTEAVQVGGGRGAYFGRDAIVSGNMVMFYTMVLIFVLIGIVVYLSKRLNRQTEREARRVIDKPVKVFLNGTLHRLQLIDISMNGAKLGHAGEVSEHDDIGIDIGGTWHSAQVRWTNAHFAGVKFKKALDPATLEHAA